MAVRTQEFKPAVLRPLTGPLDTRSPVDDMPKASFRWKENFAIDANGTLIRARGLVKPFDVAGCEYRNWDFHRQADGDDPAPEIAAREPVTMLFSSTDNDAVRRLFLGTKTRLGVLDEQNGNWTIFGTGFAAADTSLSLTQVRFRAAELNNRVLFTNNLDLIQYYDNNSQSFGGEVTGLQVGGEDADGNDVPLTAAKVILETNGLIFLMNTVEGGQRWPSRIRWCHLNNPLFWQAAGDVTPSEKSLADYQDLDYGEIILGAVALGKSIYVFTQKSIWKCVPGADPGDPGADVPIPASITLNCDRIYTEPRNQYRCLAYPNTLITDGFSAYYLGRDNLYVFNSYLTAPETPDWLHASTSIIFNDQSRKIDRRACESAVAEVVYLSNEEDRPEAGELHVSWPTYQVLAEQSVEGDPCEVGNLGVVVQGSGINNHTLVANLRSKTCDYRNYGSTAMVNHRSDVLAAGDCNQNVLFLCASGADYCLKEANRGSYREIYDPASDTYVRNGYFSILRGIFPFERHDAEKYLRSFLAEIIAEDPQDVAKVLLRVGTAYRALDPNEVNGKCGVLWHPFSAKAIKCAYRKTPEQYVAQKIRPFSDSDIRWGFVQRGKFLFYEVKIVGANGSSAPTSGACALSRLECSVRLV